MCNPKQKILKAASQLFLEVGIQGLSVRAISKRAGISTIGIYSHFKGKQGILDELYMQGFELVYSAMNIDENTCSPKTVILQGVSNYLSIADKNEAHYRLIFGESSIGYSPSDTAKAVSEKVFGRLINVASILLPEHSTMEDKKKIAIEFWAFMHGFVSLKHHVTSRNMKEEDWQIITMNALTKHIDSVIALHN
ncbi:TetR/AcrR family transcriptional regulator [Paraglaciecola arctica]|uniref:TetR/AcrR family transcriptional regulator n=1 Tax=Paraglaciecola arctica TaxID=1128911 RepID=UPI001C07BFD3|nr:TetR/AcrR family transcriptional regulator [Paraglaciecola arctica]MBU3004242.1 TetR/AcrR family transcriptional regulator [Paraglaciecola arctica]